MSQVRRRLGADHHRRRPRRSSATSPTTCFRVSETIESLDGLLSTAFDAHLASISIQQNEDMRKISAWAAIAAIGTLVAGVYGMNFHNMPELRWHYGYFFALVLMVGASAFVWRQFKKSGWL